MPRGLSTRAEGFLPKELRAGLDFRGRDLQLRVAGLFRVVRVLRGVLRAEAAGLRAVFRNAGLAATGLGIISGPGAVPMRFFEEE